VRRAGDIGRVRTLMENLEKSWNFKMVISSHGKNLNHKSFGKVLSMCNNHMFIYAEFEIIYMFFKERRSKYKPPYALVTQHVRHVSCLYREFSWSWTFGLKSWKSPENPSVHMCQNPDRVNRLASSQMFRTSCWEVEPQLGNHSFPSRGNQSRAQENLETRSTTTRIVA